MARIVLLQNEPYQLPEGALSFNENGWAFGDLHRVGIVLQGLSLDQAINEIWRLHGSLLGPGELLFATPNEHGRMSDGGRMVVDGYLVFVPEVT
jgi:hypothetical protein